MKQACRITLRPLICLNKESNYTSGAQLEANALVVYIFSMLDSSAWITALITFVNSSGVKKVYCNHLGRNGLAFPILTQTHRGEKEGRRRIK